MYRPSDLHAFLRTWGIQPKKVLSQHFLTDGNIWRNMVQAADLSPGDVVLEIGPGPGALTQLLLEKGVRVIAVEKDEELARALFRLQTADRRLEIFQDDILSFDIEAHLRKRLAEGQKAKVLANLPFSLTSPIFSKLVPLHQMIDRMALIVQEEVARRCVAKPHTAEYGRLTLFLQFYAEVQYGFRIRRSCFYPRPKVDSAVVLFQLHPPPDLDPPSFFALVRKAFLQRRKMLRSSLKGWIALPILEDVLKKRGLSVESRPENLSLEDFLFLYPFIQSDEEKDKNGKNDCGV